MAFSPKFYLRKPYVSFNLCISCLLLIELNIFMDQLVLLMLLYLAWLTEQRLKVLRVLVFQTKTFRI